jgi:hypothetical protein
MKCILCKKMCEARRAAFNKKQDAWFEAQSNNVEIMERETDPAAIYQAYDLMKTDPAESLRQYLALAEQGSVWSMASVGQIFQSGTGTAKNGCIALIEPGRTTAWLGWGFCMKIRDNTRRPKRSTGRGSSAASCRR